MASQRKKKCGIRNGEKLYDHIDWHIFLNFCTEKFERNENNLRKIDIFKRKMYFTPTKSKIQAYIIQSSQCLSWVHFACENLLSFNFGL